MSEPEREGLVVHKSSRNVRVRSGEGEWLCSIRGRFRGEGTRTLPVVVGDRVRFRPTSEEEGVLEEVLPRRNELRRARMVPGTRRGGRSTGTADERVVAANVDQVLVVLAARSPPPRWGLVDRVLISSQFEELDVGICLNKWDQVRDDADERRALEEALGVYRDLGHAAFRASFIEGEGKAEVERWLREKFTVLSGHSGVGKSTIINACCPGEVVATGRVNVVTGKGRHVTTAVACYELPEKGYLVDTPGYREYAILHLEPAEIGRYYAEFRPHLSRCRFKDCLHRSEPECGVREALERGEIARLRYENYLQIIRSLGAEG